ncbi:MAG TPA: DJ-1/PfpI family protein [Nitriliruptorales bacterium]|nr:DJ-1/PfpI family protein [Nitriliruptorales bacterium]
MHGGHAPVGVIGLVLFPAVTALDLVGPYEVLARTDHHCVLVARDSTPVESDRGLRLTPDETFASCAQLEVLVVPGGPGQAAAMHDEELIAFLREQSAGARWTASVCTGALLLARAGLLAGRRATTHWLAMAELERLGARPQNQRVVWDHPYVTAAGVSAGIDLALALVCRLHGKELAQRIQLAMEYDPQPPFAAGSASTAPEPVVSYLREHSRFAQ